jgi:hypothetical protein
MVQEQDVGALEHPAEFAVVGSELLDDLRVPVRLV